MEEQRNTSMMDTKGKGESIIAQIDSGRENFDYVSDIIDVELNRIEKFAVLIRAAPLCSEMDVQTAMDIFEVLAEKSRAELKKIFDFCDRKIGSLVVIRANYNVPDGPEPMTLLRAELDTGDVE